MDDALAAQLSRLWEQARAAWPGVELDEKAFVAHAARHIEAAPDPAAALAALHAADLYLACACVGGDARAIRELEEKVLPAVHGALARLDPSPDFLDEVRQLLRQKLLVGADPKIADYAGRGPLAAWVRVSAVRIGLGLKDAVHAEVPLDEQPEVLGAAMGDPELGWLKDRYAAELEAALGRACRSLSDRHRAVLRLRFVDGLNIDQIGVVYGVHRATVARWIVDSREQLLRETRKALGAALELSEGELDSVLRLVQSRLDFSLASYLRTHDD